MGKGKGKSKGRINLALPLLSIALIGTAAFGGYAFRATEPQGGIVLKVPSRLERLSPACQKAALPHPKCENERAVVAAEQNADWAKWQAIFGALGALGLVVTLIFNAAGLTMAWRATRDAKSALAIAEGQLAIARDTAQRELRAYVGVRRFILEDFGPGKSPHASYVICNDGATPAYNLRGAAVLEISYAAPENAKISLGDYFPTWSDLGPGREWDCAAQLRPLGRRLTAKEHEDLLCGRAVLVVRGFYSYRDSFRRIRRNTFKLFLHPADFGADSPRFGLCERNNEQT